MFQESGSVASEASKGLEEENMVDGWEEEKDGLIELPELMELRELREPIELMELMELMELIEIVEMEINCFQVVELGFEMDWTTSLCWETDHDQERV